MILFNNATIGNKDDNDNDNDNDDDDDIYYISWWCVLL